MKKIHHLLFTAFFIFLAACSDNKIHEDITKVTAEYTSSHFFNGAYLFANDKETLAQGVHGFSSFEDKESLRADQVMPIASATKTITAAAILKLHEAGKLQVGDVVAKHITAESGIWKNNIVPQWANVVTLHQLLTHTSGLPEYFMKAQLDLSKNHREINRDIINFIDDNAVQNPGYSYCNTNYVILGMIIEQITGKELGAFYDEQFFSPLDMKHTKLLSLSEALEAQDGDSSKKKNYPDRYFVTPNGTNTPIINKVGSEIKAIPYADGGVVSTTDDMVKWQKALHSGKVLSTASYQMMTKKYYDATKKDEPIAINRYTGYGIFISELPGGDLAYNHPGAAVGIRSESGYIPARKLYYAIISNIYPFIPANKKADIDFSKEENKVDILNYLLFVLSKSAK